MTDAILLHLHKYERYLHSSGGDFLRASGYNLSLQPTSLLPKFQGLLEPLKVIDPYNNIEKEILMLTPSTPIKILGVWMQPDNKQDKQ